MHSHVIVSRMRKNRKTYKHLQNKELGNNFEVFGFFLLKTEISMVTEM